METTIYFNTGTGNSLWTAKKLSESLKNTELIPATLAKNDPIHSDSKNVGFIFPVHIWGVPSRMVNFLNRLEPDSKKYYFAVAVNAGQVAATLLQFKKLLLRKNIKLSSGFSISLPSNYIPWGGAESQEKQQKKFSNSIDKINRIAQSVLAREEKNPEKGPVWQIFSFQRCTTYPILMFPKWINRSLLMKNVQNAEYAKKYVPRKIFYWSTENRHGNIIASNALPVSNGVLKKPSNTARAQ